MGVGVGVGVGAGRGGGTRHRRRGGHGSRSRAGAGGWRGTRGRRRARSRPRRSCGWCGGPLRRGRWRQRTAARPPLGSRRPAVRVSGAGAAQLVGASPGAATSPRQPAGRSPPRRRMTLPWPAPSAPPRVDQASTAPAVSTVAATAATATTGPRTRPGVPSGRAGGRPPGSTMGELHGGLKVRSPPAQGPLRARSSIGNWRRRSPRSVPVRTATAACAGAIAATPFKRCGEPLRRSSGRSTSPRRPPGSCR